MKKMLVLLLILCLLAGMVPLSAGAEGTGARSTTGTVVTVIKNTDEWYSDETKKYATREENYWGDKVTAPPEGYSVDSGAMTVSIGSAEALAWWAKQVNSGISFEGYTVNITADLNLSANYWTPICTGKYEENEAGTWAVTENKVLDNTTINGNGHTITGLGTATGLRGPNQDSQPGDGSNCFYDAAFIGYSCCNITVENLVFQDARMAISEPFDDVVNKNGSSMVSVVVGAQNGGSLTVKNVAVRGAQVLAMQKASAFVSNLMGKSSLKVENCEISDSTFSAFFMVAPIASYGSSAQVTVDGIKMSGNAVQVVEQASQSYTFDEETGAEYWSGSLNASPTTVFYDGGVEGKTGIVLPLVAEVNGYQYPTLSSAISAATENATVKLLKDTTENVTISQDKTLTLDLNGKTLTGTVEVSGALIIQDSTVTGEPTVSSDYENVTYTSGKITSSGTTVKATNGGTVTLKSGLLESTGNMALFAAGDSTGNTEVKSTVNVDGGYILSQEFAVSTQGKGATANISGGVLVAKDNAVVAGNGTNNATTKYGGTIINITGGMLIGHITTSGYIACGIYHPQQGQLNISGGTIYADEGLGILMRGGKLDMTGGKIFATANERATGKVGDSTVLVGGSAVLYDLQSGYYDGNNVEITLKGGEFSSSANVPIVSVSADENSLAEAGKRVSISGGYFTSDPSDYVADDYYAGESDNPAYAYQVKQGKKDTPPAEVVAAEPDVKAAPGIDNTVTTALSGTTATLDAAAKEQAADNKVTEETAREKLEEAEIIENDGSNPKVTVVVQPYLAMEAKSYDSTNSTMTVDIKAMYRTVATTADLDGATPEEIIVSGEVEADETANAVVIGKKENPLPVEGSVEISIPLPTDFVDSTEDEVYVQHKGYEYKADVTETGADASKTYTATFTNPHGFSTFGLSTEPKAVATVDDTDYTNFQQAVNAAGTSIIEVKADDLSATGVTHSLTLKNGTGSQITVTINGETITINAGKTETFTYTAPTPPRPTEEKHSITISTDGKGQVTGPASAAEDDKVTLTVKPNADKELYDLKVTDEDGKAIAVTKVNDTTYTFTMPDGKVTVAATFGCDGGDNCPSKAFTDLGDKQWYHDSIDYAVENGLLEGTSPTTMEPNATLIRAQLAQILYNIEDKPAVTGEMVFEDVPASEWFYSPVLWANQNEIINGTSPTTFEPLEDISRQDLALMLYRYAGKPAVTGDLDGFTDADKVGDWAEEAMAWAVAEGIVQGDTPTTLNPTGTATRAEAAAMLQRFQEDAA